MPMGDDKLVVTARAKLETARLDGHQDVNGVGVALAARPELAQIDLSLDLRQARWTRCTIAVRLIRHSLLLNPVPSSSWPRRADVNGNAVAPNVHLLRSIAGDTFASEYEADFGRRT